MIAFPSSTLPLFWRLANLLSFATSVLAVHVSSALRVCLGSLYYPVLYAYIFVCPTPEKLFGNLQLSEVPIFCFASTHFLH